MHTKKTFIIFLIFVGILFLGIAILIKPTSFVSKITPHNFPTQNEPLGGWLVPKEIIMMASVLTITGLVGLSVLGFRIFKDADQKESKPT